MGIGREVADAYIDVHGDLSSFRRDLNDMSGAEAAAMKNADKFSKAWADRIESDVNGKWASIVDAMYSDKKIDWEQLIGDFDGRSLEDANTKITEFMEKMRKAGKLTQKQFEDAKKAIDGQIDSLREQNKLLDRQEQEQQGLGMAAEANAKFFKHANEENEKWARTWEGMRKNNAIADMNEDFKKLASAMNFTDMKKFADSFDSLIKARGRIFEVTDAMIEQGRISQERAAELHAHFQAFMDDEALKAKMMKEALDETKRLKKVQDDYNQSLRGMAQAFNTVDLETKFRQLAAAINSGDWSHMARGAKSMEELRNRTMETATEMHRLGRMSDGELKMVADRIEHVSHNMGAANVEFKKAKESGSDFGKTWSNVLTRTSNMWSRLSSITQGFREHLGGFAGMNVFGDMISKGLDFIHNLDRIAVSLGKNTILMGSMAGVGVSAMASLFPIVQDLLSTVGGLAVALPAFFVGAGIGIGVLTAALQDTKTVLADLKPAFAELQNQISASFWTEAAGPIREMVKTLMPILTPKLKGTAAALGGLVGKLATAFKNIPADALNVMFDRMNKSIDILGNAMPPLVRAFTTLGVVGSKYFERFSTWMVKLADQFDAFIQKSAANGDLDRWINDMIEGFKNIARAIDGAIGIFNALNTAAEKAGFGGLKTFADNLQRAAAIMQTPEFQTTLIVYLDGARDLAVKLGDAIGKLGPAFESFAPTANIALNNIGDAAAKLIGYIGDIFTNPTFQKGVQDFTRSLDEAVAKLEPAVKPFADSLGNALTLLGRITVSVAEVATAFVVTLSPVLDSMSAKFSTLIDPLKNTVINFIKEMEGPLKALDEKFVGPLVDGFNNKLLPAINGFIDEFGPFAEKVIRDLGPSFQIIVDNVLPNFVKLATELLDPLGKIIEFLSPTLATTLEAIGTAMGNLAEAIKALKGEIPITDLHIFKNFSTEEIQRQIAEDVKPKSWGEIFSILLTEGIQTGIEFAWRDKVSPALQTAAKWFADSVSASWQAMMDGHWGTPEAGRVKWEKFWDDDAKNGEAMDAALASWWETSVYQPLQKNLRPHLEEFGRQWEAFWSAPPGGFTDTINTSVNNFLRTDILEPLGKEWDKFAAKIPESFKNDVAEWGIMPAIGNWFTNDIFPEIKKGFEQGYKDIAEGRFGFSVKDAQTFDAFRKDFNEFWTAPEGGFTDTINTTVNKFFEDNIFKPVRDAWDTAWKSVTDWLNSGGGGESAGRSDTNGQEFWNSFWGGFGGMMGDVGKWAEDINNTVNTWLDENVWKPIGKWVEELDWGQIAEDLWNGFITGLTGKDLNAWEKIKEGFTGWVEDMKNFFGIHSPSTLMFDMAVDVVTGFLNGFGDFATKVGEKWEEIKTTVATKFEELKTGIATKYEEFKVGWSEFWGGLGTGIAEKWEEIKTTVSTKWTELTTTLSEKWTEFQTGWDTFWTGFGTTLGTKWEEFKTTISTKWEELKTGLTTSWEGLKTGWDTFWTDTGTTLSTKWEEFKSTVGTKAEEIRTGVDTWAGQVKTGWDGFWGGVGETLSTKWGEFTDTTTTKAGEIKGGIEGFAGDVERNWGTFWGGVGTTLTDKWNEFTGTTDKKTSEMQGDVNDMTGNVKGDWQSMLSQMNDQINSNFQAFVNVVMDKAGEIVGWVSGLPGRIMGALGNLGGLLWAAGSNIMVGLYNGLLSMWSTVQDFVGGIAGWIAEHKGPLSYDRVLLEPAGAAIMGGLDRGIRSGMDPLLNTLQTITAAVSDTVTADLSKSVMYATGKDAAQGLADGLKANRTSVHTALGNLGAFSAPSSNITVGGSFAAVGRTSADVATGRSVTIAEGAIKIETPTKSPELVAAKLIDSFVNYSTF